ncbi:Protein WEAK CHLOROPLAST MOVEMENT UNDER BLUE LIGHT 1 [Rhynchospora pubera]|uniref:Protein WEAK CHLOROPLAST MOVEMENT UNDER BLUE LIGHT 1 n=1 Tax=Rhynchospora pubera TaxID=906938 RepID=A0AAV8CXX2_9POAL|nr:Protein WEAK CHLOROPLAST MOVEMENT UNDER BLUE LIGHT 1 [Rhynchospora pubera]
MAGVEDTTNELKLSPAIPNDIHSTNEAIGDSSMPVESNSENSIDNFHENTNDSHGQFQQEPVIDTAAPFESVKEAVSKYGGILDWKERRRRVEADLDKAQVEIPKYKTKTVAAEESKTAVLEELTTTRRLIEDLKLGIEKAQTEEKQAKQDSELAQLRTKEVKQGVAYLESAATKTQLEVEKGRHSSAVEELASVKSELETLQKEYVSLSEERDIAVKRSEKENFKSKEIERNVEELTLELITLKELLGSSHATHIEAEEIRINVALDWEKEKLDMEKEIEQGEVQLQQLSGQVTQTKELEWKLEAASDLLVSLRAEFFTYMEGKLSQELPESAEEMLKELEEKKNNLEKAKDEVKCLRVAAASLKIDLEKEKKALDEARRKESQASLSVSALEAELNQVNAELSKAISQEAKDESDELTTKLHQASEEAEHARSAASLAREELEKVKEETEETKAAARAMEMRLQAVLKEIEATKCSEDLAASTVDSLKEAEKTENLITIHAEEYHSLSKKAREAEDLANKRVILAVDQIQDEKESESSSLQKLEEAKREIEEKKEALKLAVEKAEMAQEAKLAVEQELRTWREESEQKRKAGDGIPIGLAEITNLEVSLEVNSPKVISGATCLPVSPRTYMSRTDVRNSPTSDSKARRSFFPRLIMFLARKKVQTLKT